MEPILYKKKITTITKEYYKIFKDAPTGTSTTSEVYDSEMLYPPPGQSPMYDKQAFSSSIRSYFDSYGRKMKDLIASVTGTREEFVTAEENVFANIWEISTLLRPFYSGEFTEKILQTFRAIALINIQIVDSARRGVDRKRWEDKLAPQPINDLAVILNLYNSLLDTEFVRSSWNTTCRHWIDALDAKIDNDNEKFNQHIAEADAILVTFANTLSRAVIDKYPQMFITPVPTTLL